MTRASTGPRSGAYQAALFGLALMAAGCDGPPRGFSNPDGSTDAADATDPNCRPNVDTDADGLTDAVECALGTDPRRSDTDGDQISDGREQSYPRACIGVSTPQRRPVRTCEVDAECAAGEVCRGLDPLRADTDGDTLLDGAEDRRQDGVIDPAMSDTDPRLFDTDGDGQGDAEGNAAICQPSGLAAVARRAVPGGRAQFAYAEAAGAPVEVTGTPTGHGALVITNAADQLAAAVLSLPAEGTDVREDAARVEAAVVGALGAGAAPVFVGRAFTTHEELPAVASTLRVARATSAGALRDAVVAALAMAAPPATGGTVGASDEFLVEVTTVRRGSALDVLVAVAPRGAFEATTNATALRASDVVNATGVGGTGLALEDRCETFRSRGGNPVDFIWTVDTSGSVNPIQDRIGAVAARFFESLTAAGVDFRVGIFRALPRAISLDTPGFRWIHAGDPTGARQACEQVTVGQCASSPTTESVAPYPGNGGSDEAESPVAAAALIEAELVRRTLAGEPNPEYRLRPGSKVVAFFVTDEPTSAAGSEANDWQNYFASSNDPQLEMPWGGRVYNRAALQNILAFFRRNEMLTFGMVPVYPERGCALHDPRDLPRCVIEGNGGASLPIGAVTDESVAAAFDRIVAAVAGGTSEFQLARTPITATLKVRVRGADVPRSRRNGFDYDAATRSVVFYGTQYRPAPGDQVVVSYRAWSRVPG